MGVNAYIQQAFMTDSFKQMYTEKQLQLITETPTWATAAFAIAVFGALLGSILLLMRKKIAKLFFILSFASVLVQIYYSFFMADTIEVYGKTAITLPIIIIVLGLFSIGYTSFSIKKRWVV